ncbi:glycoside hydrolase [Streptomyces sp. WZ.A104]|uniref:C40 family peptidase n=1 Tax=Streptomyces durocortorensis TaxID=2811104 RepID=A0ABY9VY83_9ACTN|nr:MULTISPECIES: C40 family peptidase [Streptomyces]PCG86805.1 glycoside hydrolase [Streptomyces sp. WZ.A104]WNF28849.1 C40 family peptidase [Streptomyces durocortorensis]
MSHTAHIPSHRKPRQRASKSALRAGVAGGVLSTIAVAGAAGPAQAEPVTQTIEMPTITSGLSTVVAASAQATQQVALDLETQADEAAAAESAAKKAKKAHAEAVRKAEAKKKAEAAAKAEAEAKERAERASRTAERTTLSASSGSTGSSDSSASASAPSSSSSSSSNVSGSAASIVAFAKAQVGDAYVSGGTGPNAWDCSGLVQAAYRTAGIDLPRVSQAQSTVGTQVSLNNLQPGDILYWGSAGSAYHVAIYVGGGQFVGAQNSSTGTVQRSMDYDRPTGAVRVL